MSILRVQINLTDKVLCHHINNLGLDSHLLKKRNQLMFNGRHGFQILLYLNKENVNIIFQTLKMIQYYPLSPLIIKDNCQNHTCYVFFELFNFL